MPIPKSILIVSNGFGEDQIARKLIDAYVAHDESVRFLAVPLVGTGTSYQHHPNITLHSESNILPSGGFLRSFKDIVKDLGSGLLKQHSANVKRIRDIQASCAATIAVGDVYALWMSHGARLSLSHSPAPLGDDLETYTPTGFLSWIQHKVMHFMSRLDKKHSGLSDTQKHPLFFLPTAKSDRFMPHSALERRIIQTLASDTFTRDRETADGLRSFGLDAQFLGNPMFDDLFVEEEPTPTFPQDPLQVAILPGSRDEALANLRYIAARLLECNPGPRYTIALAPSIDISQVKDAFEDTGWVVSPDGLRHSQTGTHISISRDFLHTVHHADIVIGLAGTANEQAAFLGKRVICFKGKGPQSSLKRFHEQAKLMGERILVLNNEDHSLSLALDQIFQNPLDHMPLALPELQNASDSIIKYVSRKTN